LYYGPGKNQRQLFMYGGQSMAEIIHDRLVKTRHLLTAAGSVRRYVQFVPPDDQTVPLVISLHGTASNARENEQLTGLSRHAAESGFILVYPEALGQPTMWNIRDCAFAPDDVAFMRGLIEHLCGRFDIDRERIFVCGFSNGGGMANRTACSLSQMVAGVASVSGAYPFWNGCHPARPIPLLAVHGTADEVVPYAGLGDSLPPIYDWIREWAQRNGCSPHPRIERTARHITTHTWLDRRSRFPVKLVVAEGGGHGWPEWASSLIWDFFDTLPRRAEDDGDLCDQAA
jgi:polyhydroxybutyrate depolymerase